ncbi:hypothetical protein NE573_24535, partial [Parabacteroides distasonis]|nr:hypothetical protein [Parabacteroides distasonis]
KMASIRKQIALYKAYYNETERQQKTLSEQFALTRRQYARDSLLYSRSVISSYEHDIELRLPPCVRLRRS